MIIDIEQITAVVTVTLKEIKIVDYEINKYSEYTNIIIDKYKSKWIIIYDDTICIAHGKNFLGSIKSDTLDWVEDKNDLIPLITRLIIKRFGTKKQDVVKKTTNLSLQKNSHWHRLIFNKRYLEISCKWGKGKDWHLWLRLLIIIFGKPMWFNMIRGPKINFDSQKDRKTVSFTINVEHITSSIEKILLELGINNFTAEEYFDENYSYINIDINKNDKYISIDNEEILFVYSKSTFSRILKSDIIYLHNIASENDFETELRKILKTRYADYIIDKNFVEQQSTCHIALETPKQQ